MNQEDLDSMNDDQRSFGQHLERIFKDLEDGIMLTLDEIDDLRYACGLPAVVRPSASSQFLKEMFIDMNNVFSEAQKPFKKGESK